MTDLIKPQKERTSMNIYLEDKKRFDKMEALLVKPILIDNSVKSKNKETTLNLMLDYIESLGTDNFKKYIVNQVQNGKSSNV